MKNFVVQKVSFIFLLGVFLIILPTSCKKTEIKIDDSNAVIQYFIDSGFEKLDKVVPIEGGGLLYVGRNAGDAYIMAVDEKGNKSWDITSGGSGTERFTNVLQTSDGGFLAVGISNSPTFGTADWRREGLSVKIGANGNVEWTKYYSKAYDVGFWDVMETPDGHYVYVGRAQPDNLDSWILKSKTNGEEVWSKAIDVGVWHDEAKQIALKPNGDYMLLGISSWNNGGPGTSEYREYSLSVEPKFGAQPELIIYDQLVRDKPFDADFLTFDAISDNEGITMVTYVLDQYSAASARFLKIDWDGNLLVKKEIFGLGATWPTSLVKVEDGGYLITGVSEDTDFLAGTQFVTSKYALFKTDDKGEIEWSNYSGSESANQSLFGANWLGDKIQVGGSSPAKDGYKLSYFEIDNNGKTLLNRE